MICCNTIIGNGSPKLQGGDKEHGAALGGKEVPCVREYIGWDAASFNMPADVRAAEDSNKRGALQEAGWNERFGAYSSEFPQQAAELTCRMQGVLPQVFEVALSFAIVSCVEKKENIATRKAGQSATQAQASSLQQLLGSLADLTGLNLTNWKKDVVVRSGQPGKHMFTRQ